MSLPDTLQFWPVVMAIALGVFGICTVVIIVTAVRLKRHVNRLKKMQIILTDANRAKDEYINQFIVLCSVYMDKLNQYDSIVNRKLSAGQVDELYKLVKSGRLIEEQIRDFYRLFDQAFLHIYPNFVTDINNLLNEDERIKLKEEELLNTDLRILACLRIGLTDATQIAKILNLSVNTIYAYRNRIRNRAISRETFEKDLLKTGI